MLYFFNSLFDSSSKISFNTLHKDIQDQSKLQIHSKIQMYVLFFEETLNDVIYHNFPFENHLPILLENVKLYIREQM